MFTILFFSLFKGLRFFLLFASLVQIFQSASGSPWAPSLLHSDRSVGSIFQLQQ